MNPFLSLGCDIVSIDRIARLAARYPRQFLARVMGADERVALENRTDWRRWARHVAAKEAMFKALGTGLGKGMRWSDVQVLYTNSRPRITVSGVTRQRYEAIGARQIFVSFSDDRTSAVAIVGLRGDSAEIAGINGQSTTTFS